MVGFFVRAGKVLKEGIKTVKIKPGTKFKEAGDAAVQRIKAAAKKIDKLNKTIQDQKKILDK